MVCGKEQHILLLLHPVKQRHVAIIHFRAIVHLVVAMGAISIWSFKFVTIILIESCMHSPPNYDYESKGSNLSKPIQVDGVHTRVSVILTKLP